MAKEEKICRVCNEKFIAYKKDQKMCSQQCAKREKIEKSNGGWKK